MIKTMITFLNRWYFFDIETEQKLLEEGLFKFSKIQNVALEVN